MDILVTGASGFVGGRLAGALVAQGHDVRAMTRNPDRYHGAGRAVRADVGDADSLDHALRGADVAYYLVHSLDSDDFERRDAEAALSFGAAARTAGVGRIVYLGGLGAEDPTELSPHLRSRRIVEGLLGAGGVPVTTLRAAIVVGEGGVSWEITRQLVKRLPLMVTPSWVSTTTQPIALDDAVRCLVAAADGTDTERAVLEIGGADVLTYGEMLTRAAHIMNGRPLPILTVPLLTPRLSSLWITLVTDVNNTTSRHLVESMSEPVYVRGTNFADAVVGAPMGYDEMVVAALAERADRSARAD